MKTPKLLTVGALVMVLPLTAALTASAQDRGPQSERPVAEAEAMPVHFRDGRGPGGGHDGHHRKGRGGEMGRTLFDAVDADGDRTVTDGEIAAYRAGKLAEIDTSGDGALSIGEFDTLYRELTRWRMVDMFQDLDEDGDGVISAAEMDKRIDRMMERMDRNGDGALTLLRPGQPVPPVAADPAAE